MKRQVPILFLICSLLAIGCSKPQDPVTRFILYMNKRLNILEKYKNDPERAGLVLEKYNRSKVKETNQLIEDLKSYNKGLTSDNSQETMEKIKPVVDRIIILIGESPTLLLNENVAKAFDAFDMGL